MKKDFELEVIGRERVVSASPKRIMGFERELRGLVLGCGGGGVSGEPLRCRVFVP
jgi:hypothetical protein